MQDKSSFKKKLLKELFKELFRAGLVDFFWPRPSLRNFLKGTFGAELVIILAKISWEIFLVGKSKKHGLKKN